MSKFAGKKVPAKNSLSVHLRLQLSGRNGLALGPGKVALLILIDETGSISEAARRMKMSYMKAWTLIQSLKPLVQSSRGGDTGGGAKLTDHGRAVLVLYQKMERDSRRACETSWSKLQALRVMKAPAVKNKKVSGR